MLMCCLFGQTAAMECKKCAFVSMFDAYFFFSFRCLSENGITWNLLICIFFMHHIRITFPYYDWINEPIFFQICNLDWIVYIRWQSNHCDCWYKPELCCLDVILNRPESQLPSMKIAMIRIIPTFRSHFHTARVNFTQIPPEHNDHRIKVWRRRTKQLGNFRTTYGFCQCLLFSTHD